MATLRVINGTPAPDTPTERVRRRLRAGADPTIAQCHRCGCREVIETRTGVTLRNGRASGGTPALLCAYCHSQGLRVVVA